MVATENTTKPRDPIGPPVELGRYTCDVGERLLVGQRVDGFVQLRDEPAGGAGRSFLVEARLESMGELEAIVADYVRTAQRLGFVPMVSLGW